MPTRATVAPRPQLSVVPPVVPSRGRIAFLVICMLLLVGGLVGSLALNTMMAQGSYQQSSIQREIAQEAQRRDILETKLNYLNTPENLARSAKKLGMSQQQAPMMIRLEDKTIIGLAD